MPFNEITNQPTIIITRFGRKWPRMVDKPSTMTKPNQILIICTKLHGFKYSYRILIIFKMIYLTLRWNAKREPDSYDRRLFLSCTHIHTAKLQKWSFTTRCCFVFYPGHRSNKRYHLYRWGWSTYSKLLWQTIYKYDSSGYLPRHNNVGRVLYDCYNNNNKKSNINKKKISNKQGGCLSVNIVFSANYSVY